MCIVVLIVRQPPAYTHEVLSILPSLLLRSDSNITHIFLVAHRSPRILHTARGLGKEKTKLGLCGLGFCRKDSIKLGLHRQRPRDAVFQASQRFHICLQWLMATRIRTLLYLFLGAHCCPRRGGFFCVFDEREANARQSCPPGTDLTLHALLAYPMTLVKG